VGCDLSKRGFIVGSTNNRSALKWWTGNKECEVYVSKRKEKKKREEGGGYDYRMQKKRDGGNWAYGIKEGGKEADVKREREKKTYSMRSKGV
jgi:hypothetical protein